MNFDVNLPHEYNNKFNLFFDSFRVSLDWNNITYSDVDLDIADIQLQLKRQYDKQVVSMKFPALKHWEVNAY